MEAQILVQYARLECIQSRGPPASIVHQESTLNRTKIIQQFLTKFPPAATRAKREHTVPLKVLPPSLCAKIARLGDSPPQLAPIQTQPATNAHRVPIILTKALLPHRLARYAKVQKYRWTLGLRYADSVHPVHQIPKRVAVSSASQVSFIINKPICAKIVILVMHAPQNQYSKYNV